jgi:ABC-type nitrate/sulfonate/bicarbonate transport system substrate-binding protein
MTILVISSLLRCFTIEAAAETKIPLRIGYLPLLRQLPLVVSYENDRMTLNKVKLELDRHNSYNSLEAALRVGAIDAASIPVPMALSIAADGHPIKIIAAIHMGGSRLLAKNKGGFETLRGKLIGVPGLDSGENLMLNQVMSAADLRPGFDYKTIGVSLNTVINDLKSNRIDAIYLPEPYGTIAEKEGLCIEVDGQQEKLAGTLETVLVIRSEIIEKNESAVQEWLESLIHSCHFVENDIAKSGANQTAIIQSTYFDFPKSIVIESLVNRKGGLKLDLLIPLSNEIKKTMDLSSKMKMLTKSVNLDNLIATKLTDQVIKKVKTK